MAGGIEVERHLNEGAFDGIDYDGAKLGFIEIPDRGFAVPDASGDLLLLSAPDIHREIIGIIFGLTEGEIEHQLTLWGRLKPETAEAKIGELAIVDEVNDPSAVKGIACQAVGMPCDDAIGLTPLYALKHFIEERTAFDLCTLALLKAADNVELIFLNHFADFSQLIADGAGLPLLPFGRFADVNEIFVLVFHADTLARRMTSAKGADIHTLRAATRVHL